MRAKSIGREEGLSRELSRFPQNATGPAGARQGAPTRNQTDWRLKKQRPPIPWKSKRLMVFSRDALGFGPGNAAHFSLTLATWRKVKVGKLLGKDRLWPVIIPGEKALLLLDKGEPILYNQSRIGFAFRGL